MSLPVLTPEEKLNALKKAQEMRSKRAELRNKLKKGTITLREVLEKTDDEVVARMRVTYLISVSRLDYFLTAEQPDFDLFATIHDNILNEPSIHGYLSLPVRFCCDFVCVCFPY